MRAALTRMAVHGAIVIAAMTPIGAQAQKWNFQPYAQGKPTSPGYILLEESGGEYRFQLVASNLDSCYRSPMKASVEKTSASLTVTPIFPFRGCGEVRYIIRNDGTGGVRQFKVGEEWKSDGLDRGLSLKSAP